MPLCHLLLVNTKPYSVGQNSATISNVREVTLLNSIINKRMHDYFIKRKYLGTPCTFLGIFGNPCTICDSKMRAMSHKL